MNPASLFHKKKARIGIQCSFFEVESKNMNTEEVFHKKSALPIKSAHEF